MLSLDVFLLSYFRKTDTLKLFTESTKSTVVSLGQFAHSIFARYWNSSLRSDCPTLDDSEGITLRSLGGVFIATLVGLAIAMVTLGFEVAYYKKKEKNEIIAADGRSTSKIMQVTQKDGIQLVNNACAENVRFFDFVRFVIFDPN